MIRIILVFFLISILNNQLKAVDTQTLHVEHSSLNNSWYDVHFSIEMNIKKLLQALSKSSIGQELIHQARIKAAESGLQLEKILRAGASSLTDTTLLRKFSPFSPEKIIYELKSVVYINRELSFHEAILDLAHELTHYVYKNGFNPYGNTFQLDQFIKSTIEGRGGEVHAFLVECKVREELFSLTPFSKTSQKRPKSQCDEIKDERKFSFTKATKLFYQVGDYYFQLKNEFSKRNKDHLIPLLSDKKASFISSAYGLPYPVAALREFDNVLERVCENDEKRIAYMKKSEGRSPSSLSQEQIKFLQSHRERCP